MRASADGIVLEFGPSREQNLLWRYRIIRWQSQMRILFLTRIALWKYRAQLPGFELPQTVAVAQRAFDDELAEALEAMADRIDGRASQIKLSQGSLAPLELAVRAYEGSERQQETADGFRAFLSLHRRTETLTSLLQEEIENAL